MNKKILIVDDDPDMRLGLQVRLRANNYDTCFASDAMTAISEARRHNPDLVILDLGLPAGDGFLVLEQLNVNNLLGMIPACDFCPAPLPQSRAGAQGWSKSILSKAG